MKLRSGFRLICLTAVIFLLAGCAKKQFVIDFRLNADVDGNYRIMFYASDSKQGFWMESMVPIERGAYTYTGPVVNPCLVYILNRHSREPGVIFYVEKGDKITVSGDGPEPVSWKIAGNSLSKEWSDWRISNLKALQSDSPEQINRCVADYVRKNSDNRLAALLLLTSYRKAGHENEFIKLWNSLPDRVRNEKIVKLVASSEFASAAPFVSADNNTLTLAAQSNIKPFRLHSLENGVDTINTKTAPTIMMLWHSQDENRYELVGKLKELVREFPDSARRNIVDISLDPDSLSWSGSCSRDSLYKTVRGWEPMGEASPFVMRLGIVSTPAFVVLDKGGKVVYSGADSEKAANVFRKRITK